MHVDISKCRHSNLSADLDNQTRLCLTGVVNAVKNAAPPPCGADPRPQAVHHGDAWQIAGSRCRSCGRAVAYRWPGCPACRGDLVAESFGPDGTVWSATTVHLPVDGITPPYSLVYLDLDDGPRVLAHTEPLPASAFEAAGGRARLIAPSDRGDLRAELR